MYGLGACRRDALGRSWAGSDGNRERDRVDAAAAQVVETCSILLARTIFRNGTRYDDIDMAVEREHSLVNDARPGVQLRILGGRGLRGNRCQHGQQCQQDVEGWWASAEPVTQGERPKWGT